MVDEPEEFDGAIEIPIDGVLDLHHFKPRDINTLIPDYLDECRHRGITEVRIIHGKGSGKLKRGVFALLARLPAVESYHPAGQGNWGATVVYLKKG